MKLLAAVIILLVSTSGFASARMVAPKDLAWESTPEILSPGSCEDLKICVGSAIYEGGRMLVTCKSLIPTDCPDARTCFERNSVGSNKIPAELAATKITRKVSQGVPSSGRIRNPPRGVGSGKPITPYVPASN